MPAIYRHIAAVYHWLPKIGGVVTWYALVPSRIDGLAFLEFNMV